MSHQSSDKQTNVRPGEELDLKRLDPWLKENIAGLEGSPSVTQYSGGASNWTYCLHYSNQDVVLRRAPRGTKAKGAHDMGREYRLQKALKPVYRYVPAMLAHCDDLDVLGSEFYVMERLDGWIPRKHLPRNMQLDAEQVNRLCLSTLDCLIELHQVDYQQAGLAHLAKGAGYVERQVEGWCHRYQKAKTWNVPAGKSVMHWLQTNMPKDETICLTHNDFRLDNMVYDRDQIDNVLGVLDWELATLGDPLMDLGNTLAYWIQADDDRFAQRMRQQPTHLPGMMTRAQVLEYYLSKTNTDTSDFRFYEVFGYFRLAGIVQQIYYRYHHKQTRNPRFKSLWTMVHYLMHRSRRAIKGN